MEIGMIDPNILRCHFQYRKQNNHNINLIIVYKWIVAQVKFKSKQVIYMEFFKFKVVSYIAQYN